ncbi:GIP [Symbiodinium sp. CCMP2592]|nr:GIP [Symbiodinium sp. CCMP2592]
MSAQPLTATPVLEGEETGPRYGALHQGAHRADVPGRGEEQGPGDQPLMNGVDPPRLETVRGGPPMTADPRPVDQTLDGGAAQQGLETSAPAQAEPETTTAMSRPILGTDVRPGEGSDYQSFSASPPSPRRPRVPTESTMDQPHRAERTVAMEYSYETAEGMPGVRWVARLTEFLRATTTRTSGLQGHEPLRSLEQGHGPLFTPEQGSSTSSDEIQAEVQRQLARYVQRYEGEAQEIGLQRTRIYQQEIGLQRTRIYQQEIGLQHSSIYQQEIGLQRSSIYQQEIGLQSSSIYQQEIGLQRSSIYQQEIGLQSSSIYQQEIGLQRSRIYQQEIGLQRSRIYQQEIGPMVSTSEKKKGVVLLVPVMMLNRVVVTMGKMTRVLDGNSEAAFRTSLVRTTAALEKGPKVKGMQALGETFGRTITTTGRSAAIYVNGNCGSPFGKDYECPIGRRQPKEGEGPEALKRVIEDASNMLKSMMASSGLPTPSTSSSAPTYESIQRQLDELKLKTMKVDGTKEAKAADDSGVLLDSGATHVLRAAHDQVEEDNTKAVSVTLAGDEQRILKQAPSGSILLSAEDKDRVQPIVPFGAMIDVLGCTLKWSKGGFTLIHPRHGRIRTRLRAGCPEMTDAAQAAEIIAELEMKKVEELRQRAEGLQQRLNAVRMMEVKQEDWRQNLAAYAQEGCVVDGLQVLFKSPIFKDLPEAVTGTMIPNVEVTDEKGWEYLKSLPLCRRLRKRLMRSKAWILNMYGGKTAKADPVQALTGQINPRTNTEVVVVNVDVLLNGGWSMVGPAYKALMWGAMSSRVKAVLGAPPAGTFSVKRHEDRPGYPSPVRSTKEPYGLSDLNPTERYYVDKETTLVARQLMLYLVAHARSGGDEVKFCMSHPENAEEIVNGQDAPSLWRTPMMKAFLEVTEPLGVKTVSFDQGAFGYLSKSPTTLASNLDFEFFEDMREDDDVKKRKVDERRPWVMAVRRNVAEKLLESGVASTRVWAHREPGPDIRKMTAEQGWRLHVQRDHVPFRKDCEQCVMSLGTGRPHRRTKQKSAYVLSVDVGGPLRAVSRDAHGYGYRYFLAAAYTKPKFEDQDEPPEFSPEDLAAEDYDFRNLDLEVPELDEPADDEAEPDQGDGYADPGDAEPEGGVGYIDPGRGEFLDLGDEEGDPSVRKIKGDELWDDDEEAERQQRADQEQDELLEGNREIPMDHLYFVKPLKGKKAKQVMQAIQEIILELKHMNLPVVRIHSDRAHELRSPALREWTLGQQIMLTRTECQSPQSNGTAERAVRYLKGQARLLLRTSGLPTSHWATAMVTAAHNQREKRLNPETFNPVCPYGTRVAIKKKRYSDGGKHDLMPHWVKGTYLGPVWDVRNGSAVLEDENGRIMVTTNVRPRLHDPGTAADAAVREFEPPSRRRLRGKSAVDADGVAVRSLTGSQKASHRRRLVKEILELVAKDPVHSVKRPQLVAEAVPDSGSSYVTMGAFNHGGQYGVTKYTSEAPELTRKVTELLQLDFPDECFTSATLVKNTCMPTHRDVFNEKNSWNLVSPLQVTEGAGVWEELKPGDVFSGRYMEMLVNDKTTPGQVHSLTNPAKVNPKRWHCAVQGTEGPRLIVVGHTIGSWRKLTPEMEGALEVAGFVLPEEGDDQARVRAIQEVNDQVLHYPYVTDEDDEIKAVTASGLKFEQGTADPNIWRVVDSNGELKGLIAVYVDDYLVTGPREVCEDVHAWFSTTWQTTDIQFATKENAIRFLGMEIRSVENDNGDFIGFSLDQEGYVQELLRQYDIGEKQMSTIPSAKEWMSLDPETFPESFDAKDLKAAQSITGELAWLGQRCRPDLAYTVSVMSSMMSKDPVRTVQIGKKTLAYLNYTKEWKLLYGTGGPKALITYTDSSYAPDGDKSHGGAVVFWSGSPVAWRSGRQGLIATSSAETELLAASEGCTLTASVDALLKDMGAEVEERELRVDNSAAIVLASEEGGSWRTRHLKVRAGSLRQQIQRGWISISYCPGDRQLADGLTKILAAKRMEWILQVIYDPDKFEVKAKEGAYGEFKHQLSNNRSSKEDFEAHLPLAVDSSLELYGVILMLVICVIALWEGSRHCYRRAEAARVRSMQVEQRLSKKEMRKLNQLLQEDPAMLQLEDRVTLTGLAEKAGVDLTRILTRESVRGGTPAAGSFEQEQPRPPPPPPEAACAADEDFLRRRRRERSEKAAPSRPPRPVYSEDSYDVPDPPRIAEGILGGRGERTRDAGVQVELLKEMPRVVYITPSVRVYTRHETAAP